MLGDQKPRTPIMSKSMLNLEEEKVKEIVEKIVWFLSV